MVYGGDPETQRKLSKRYCWWVHSVCSGDCQNFLVLLFFPLVSPPSHLSVWLASLEMNCALPGKQTRVGGSRGRQQRAAAPAACSTTAETFTSCSFCCWLTKMLLQAQSLIMMTSWLYKGDLDFLFFEDSWKRQQILLMDHHEQVVLNELSEVNTILYFAKLHHVSFPCSLTVCPAFPYSLWSTASTP